MTTRSPLKAEDVEHVAREELRETIARVVAPDYWDIHDHYAKLAGEWQAVEPGDRLALQFRQQADEAVAPSLAKADAIMAILPQAREMERALDLHEAMAESRQRDIEHWSARAETAEARVAALEAEKERLLDDAQERKR